MFISEYIEQHNVVVMDKFEVNNFIVYKLNNCSNVFVDEQDEIQFVITGCNINRQNVLCKV